MPFTADYGGVERSALKTVWNMVYFLPLGLILSLWPGQTFRRGTRVLAVGFLVAAGIQFLKLFVWSRDADVTDILTGSVAVWLGWRLLETWRAHQAEMAGKPWYLRPLSRPGLFLVWLALMIAVNWLSFLTLWRS